MVAEKRFEIPARGVKLLCWIGDRLGDWKGGAIYALDGSKRPSEFSYPHRFDAAIASPSGRYVVLYERLGTKGLLLGPDRRVLRELNRSYYHATAYEYPVVLFALPDGRDVIAHCPEEYNRVEIEEVESGRRLTAREGRSPDFFHSRLAVNCSGTWLLSAGWVWHPLEMALVFRVSDAISRPASLDEGTCPVNECEVSSAALVGEDRLIVASAKGSDDLEDERGESLLRPGWIGVFDLSAKRWELLAELEEEAGTLMPVGKRHVIGFYEYPKLIELASGRVVHRWRDLKTGTQNGSIIHHIGPLPVQALDPQHARFAVADMERIIVIEVTVAPS